METLVIGGTGMVGSEGVRLLLHRGEGVRILTRSKEKWNTLPRGTEGVVGDLKDPESLGPAFQGVRRVFLITPLSPTETEEGMNAVRAAEQTGVEQLVYLSVHRVEEAPHIPHFRSKIEIQRAIRERGLPATFIQPNNFFQNDLAFRQALLEQGVYPQPIGDVGLSRVDVRDIAEAAVNALLDPAHRGKEVPLAGPGVWTGQKSAEIWSRHLDRRIRYAGNDLDAWGEQVRTLLPDWLIHDLKIMYQYFQEHGLLAREDDFERQEDVLGRPPRSYEDFVRERAAAWTRKSA